MTRSVYPAIIYSLLSLNFIFLKGSDVMFEYNMNDIAEPYWTVAQKCIKIMADNDLTTYEISKVFSCINSMIQNVKIKEILDTDDQDK